MESFILFCDIFEINIKVYNSSKRRLHVYIAIRNRSHRLNKIIEMFHLHFFTRHIMRTLLSIAVSISMNQPTPRIGISDNRVDVINRIVAIAKGVRVRLCGEIVKADVVVHVLCCLGAVLVDESPFTVHLKSNAVRPT